MSASGVRVDVPPNLVGRVIGRGGETIKRLQQESGARIQIDRQTNRVEIQGTNEAIERAKTLIREVVDSAEENRGPPGGDFGGGPGGPQRTTRTMRAEPGPQVWVLLL